MTRQLCDLPNVDGFEFIGICRDDSERRCVVIVQHGRFTVADWTDLNGWRPVEPMPLFPEATP